jgi:tetratricopeptide (TPR) repeat protein
MTTLESTSFDALMAQGMAASQADDAERAIACFQKASATAPEAALPQFLLGAEFAALGDMNAAETAFANATRLAPGFPMARYQLGLLQFSSHRAALALLTWQPLLQLPDSDPLPHFVNGFESLTQDRFEDALRDFQQGIALNTDNGALTSDIEKVIAGVRTLMSGAAPEGEITPQPSSESEAHVLLAGYQQRGPAH